MATSQMNWQTPAPAPQGPAMAMLLSFTLSVVTLGIALGSFAYLGHAPMGLALVIAAGGFLFVVAQPVFALLVLISTMLLTYPDVLTGKGLLTINNLLGVTLVVIMLVKIFVSHNTWFLREREFKLLCLIFVAALFLTVIAEMLLPKLSTQLMIETKLGEFRAARDLTVSRFKDFFSRLAFFIFLVYFVSTKKHVKWVLLSLLGCILIALPAAFSNLMSGIANDARITAGFSLGGGSGWLSNENRFAFMCLLGMSLLFYFSSIAKSRLFSLIAVPLSLAFATLILFSGSRSGLLSLIVTGGWLLTRRGSLSLQARLGVLVLSLVVGLALFPTLPPRLQERLLNLNPFNPEGEGSHSTEVRVTTLRESAGIFARYPLTGVGIGNFRWINFYYNGNFKPPHNSYMWALSEGGLFVAFLYGFLFVTLFKRLRSVRQLFHDDPELPYIGEWLSFYLVAFLFFSIFADIWLEEIHLYMITGLAIVAGRLAAPEAPETIHAAGPSRLFY
jgi:O-antigen ligase